MCGRFLINEESLQSAECIAEIPEWVQEQLKFGDIFPSQPSLVLRREKEHLEGSLMPFGFYSESLRKRIINARAESADRKWMFRQALASNRCVVVCSLFYEWDAQKQMLSFYSPDHQTLYLAGLIIDQQFVILTTQANPSVSFCHPRMPLILDREQAQKWVLDSNAAAALLHTVPPALDHSGSFEQQSLF